MKKLIPVIMLFFLSLPSVAGINVTLIYQNETEANLSYDRVNASLGSFSYKDNSIINPNVYMKVCGINQTFNQTFLDLLYSSESGNITLSILTIKPQIYNITNNCTTLDVDISAFSALYPAIPFAAIYRYENVTNNETNQTELQLVRIHLEKMNSTRLLGRYVMGVDIDDIAKEIYLSVQKIYDEKNESIVNASRDYLIISIVLNNVSQVENVTSPKSSVAFDYMFSSSEIVYVNGLPSLRVKVVPPCTVINETGYYYVLNYSAWNKNDTCLVVNNTNNIVIDFANKTIDGNSVESLEEDKCGVVVQNSYNLTLRGVKVQEYNKGVCILNSTGIKIFGFSDQFNAKGVYVENSTAKIARLKLNNTESEIFGINSSILTLEEVYFATANLSAVVKDVRIRNVFNPPPDPENLINISQWINISKLGDSWIDTIKFHFLFPNEQGVLPKVIYKIDGNYTDGVWQNVSWFSLDPTYVDVTTNVIFSPILLTNFSLFAPYGERVNVTEPTPTPTPTPAPTPSEVAGGKQEVIPPRLDLKLLNKTVTIEQGATAEVWFNITNRGAADIYDSRVDAEVRRGWERTFKDFNVIYSGETKTDKILISVYENEIPGTYWIPVKAILKKNNVTVDVELLKVIVVPRKRVARVDILELPPFLSLPEYSSVPVAILVKNTGDYNLKNITLKIENGENCIGGIDGSYELKIGEKKSLVFTLHTKEAPKKCETVFVLESDRGPVALYPVIIQITPSLGAKSIFYFIRILPILLILWTILTIRAWRKKL